jgi:hypothetical protein
MNNYKCPLVNVMVRSGNIVGWALLSCMNYFQTLNKAGIK